MRQLPGADLEGFLDDVRRQGPRYTLLVLDLLGRTRFQLNNPG